MKRKTVLTVVAGVLVLGGLVATRTTDGYFVAATIAFFLLCAAYAEWCARL